MQTWALVSDLFDNKQIQLLTSQIHTGTMLFMFYYSVEGLYE